MKMRKHIIAIAALSMILSLTGCGTVSTPTEQPVSTTTTTTAAAAAESAADNTASAAETTVTKAKAESAAAESSSAAKKKAAETESSSAAAPEADKVTTVTESSPAQNEANNYGFVAITEVPHTSISVKQFEGTWVNPRNPIRSVNFYDCDFLNGKFTMQNSDNSLTEGIIRLEYKLEADGSKGQSLYNLYDNNGEYQFGIDTNTDIPFNSFVSADGITSFVRDDKHAWDYQYSARTTEDYVGTWGCASCTITITDVGGTYDVDIIWRNSAAEYTHWVYRCGYEDQDLSAFGGSCTEISYSEDGTETDTEMYTDGAARFYINDSGHLEWNDLKDNAGMDMEFIKS